MSEAKDSCCIFMTINKNTRCLKTAVKKHPNLNSLGIDSDWVLCTIHYNYMVNHSNEPMSAESNFFDCPKTRKLVTMLKEMSVIISIKKLSDEFFTNAYHLINACIEEENIAREIIMNNFSRIIDLDKANTIVNEKKKNMTNKNLKLVIDKMKSSFHNNISSKEIINKFGTSYKVRKLYDHFDVYDVIHKSCINVNEQMEEEFFFYKKIREELLIDYQARMNKLRIRADENMQKIIEKYKIEPKKKCVYEYLKRKEGAKITNKCELHNTIIMNNILEIETPRGTVVCNKYSVYQNETKINNIVVNLDNVSDFDEFFGFSKETLTKALSYKNIAKHVMDFIGIEFVFDLYCRIRNYKIIAPIHNYFRLERTLFFPEQNNYFIHNIYMCSEMSNNVFGYVFICDYRNDKNESHILIPDDIFYHGKRTNRNSKGDIYFDLCLLCIEIFQKIPDNEIIISNLLKNSQYNTAQLIKKAKNDLLVTHKIKYPVLEFLDRKQLLESDIKSVAKLKENIIPRHGDHYPFFLNNNITYIQLNLYIVKYIETVLNVTF